MPKPPSRRSSSGEIDQFLQKSKAITQVVERQPRLIFAIDATASRQPTWDNACQLQGEMFRATASIATLAVQLCYYRGFNEFYASRWLLAPIYLGLSLALLALGIKFFQEVFHLLPNVLATSESDLVLVVLG